MMLHTIYANTANVQEAYIVERFEVNQTSILVVYVTYTGGGESYEYSILNNGEIMSSDSGYGDGLTCLIDAMKLAKKLGYITL
jgi:hypothetical protein